MKLLHPLVLSGVLASLSGGLIPSAHGQLPFQGLTEKVLRESSPFSFISLNRSVDLSPEDFEVTGNEKTQWIPGSMQWVRAGVGPDEPGILVPRARLLQNGSEKEVALTQVDNPVRLKFRPRASLKTRTYIDASCSPYHLQIPETKLPHSWVMVSCHLQYYKNAEGTKPVVLATVLWENEVEGTLQQVNLDSDHSRHAFKSASADSFELRASVPPVFHHLNFSAGLGPYMNRNSLKAFGTIYASYFFSDDFKLAAFGALPVRAKPEVDWGMYLVLGQYRGFDDRISINLLLGAHVLSYVPSGQARAYSVSGPQGIELIFRDLFIKRMNFVAGGFFYPKINDRSYVNAWARYGSNRFFLELNYIEWQEPEPRFYSKSVGLSVGFPLFRAF